MTFKRIVTSFFESCSQIVNRLPKNIFTSNGCDISLGLALKSKDSIRSTAL